MKKSILALTLVTAVFFSCKKEKTTTDFSATDVTGSTTVKGVCTKNIVTPNGSGGWTTFNTVPAAGVLVQIKVNKSQLYPNSIAQGADVYSATTNTLGEWAMSVKSTAGGVNGYLTIAGFHATQDTVINGVTKTGLWANYFGNSTNITLIMGTTYDYGVHNFSASNLNSNPNNIMIGSAVLSGSISMNLATKLTTGTVVTIGGSTNVAIPAGITVYMTLDKDPTLLAPKMYTTTTTAGGKYSFNFPTVALGTAGFNQNATIWVADYAANRDTHVVVNNAIQANIAGPSGVFGNSSTNEFGLYNNEIRNATNFGFGGFTPN